jgi:hypothetical protein
MTGSGVGELAVIQSAPKIQGPVLGDGLVARTGLLGHLAATPNDVPLVVLTAPAGYGKTTVLSQWSAADGREFAWVTVEQADEDPVRLAGALPALCTASSRWTRRSSGRWLSGTDHDMLSRCCTCWRHCGTGRDRECWCSTTSTSCAASRR